MPDPKVVPMHDYLDIPTALRNIAKEVEDGRYGDDITATLVIDGEVFGLGVSGNAFQHAMWDLQTGQAKLIELWREENGA